MSVSSGRYVKISSERFSAASKSSRRIKEPHAADRYRRKNDNPEEKSVAMNCCNSAPFLRLPLLFRQHNQRRFCPANFCWTKTVRELRGSASSPSSNNKGDAPVTENSSSVEDLFGAIAVVAAALVHVSCSFCCRCCSDQYR